MNKRLKGLIRGLHSNAITKLGNSLYPSNAISRAAQSIGVLQYICDNFEEQNDFEGEADKHNPPNFMKDVEIMEEVLIEMEVFDVKAKRKHRSFPNFNAILQQCPSNHLKIWKQDRIKTYQM